MARNWVDAKQICHNLKYEQKIICGMGPYFVVLGVFYQLYFNDGVRLWYLHCVSNGDAAVMHKAIDFVMQQYFIEQVSVSSFIFFLSG